MTRVIGKKGLDILHEFEGKLKDIGGGRYQAYLCPAGKLTIYIGCTHGVTAGMIVTEAEGREMLARELDENCREVGKMVRVPISQAQFDALVCLAYNIGWPTLAKSTLMRKLNAGDYAGASARFNDFRKARKGRNGPRVTMPGLVRRRAAEADLFLSDIPLTGMPQAVSATPVQFTTGDTIKVGGGLALGISSLVEGSKSAVEAAKPVTDAVKPTSTSIDQLSGLKTVADEMDVFRSVIASLKGSFEFLLQNWELSVVCAVAALAITAIANLRSTQS